MKKSLKIFSLAVASAFTISSSSQAQAVYKGNGNGGFGGTIGQGMLTFSSDGTTLTGTITQGGSSGFNDELVIYIDDQAGGFGTTSTFTDTGGGDKLREATSGLGSNGTTRAPLNFTGGFGADYAIALSPAKAQFGAVYTLDNVANFTYDGSASLSPTGTNTAATYTFSFPLSDIGSPTSFHFATTYLDGVGAYRSNEAVGNTITDVTNPANTNPSTGNLGQDTGAVGFSTFNVPEPSTWAMLVGGAGMLAGFRRRRN